MTKHTVTLHLAAKVPGEQFLAAAVAVLDPMKPLTVHRGLGDARIGATVIVDLDGVAEFDFHEVVKRVAADWSKLVCETPEEDSFKLAYVRCNGITSVIYEDGSASDPRMAGDMPGYDYPDKIPARRKVTPPPAEHVSPDEVVADFRETVEDAMESARKAVDQVL